MIPYSQKKCNLLYVYPSDKNIAVKKESPSRGYLRMARQWKESFKFVAALGGISKPAAFTKYCKHLQGRANNLWCVAQGYFVFQ